MGIWSNPFEILNAKIKEIHLTYGDGKFHVSLDM